MTKTNTEYVRELRKQRVLDGICKMARKHGQATDSQLCRACYEKKSAENLDRQERNVQQGFCRFSKRHGPNVKNDTCLKCYEKKLARGRLTPKALTITIEEQHLPSKENNT